MSALRSITSTDWCRRGFVGEYLLLVFIQILDAVLVDKQVGRIIAMDLQAGPIVPFDVATQFGSIIEHQHHLHLGVARSYLG